VKLPKYYLPRKIQKGIIQKRLKTRDSSLDRKKLLPTLTADYYMPTSIGDSIIEKTKVLLGITTNSPSGKASEAAVNK